MEKKGLKNVIMVGCTPTCASGSAIRSSQMSKNGKNVVWFAT
ncbi:MAG: hypothetical protein CM1200mP2_01820 [Planctomycetaceae bacterium]|nr:MAG: hypothetical protein CM1200mP2_01820 [Planctomycetaceae bacterium]